MNPYTKYIAILCGLLLGIIITVEILKDKDENRCPYEGAECPNVHKYLQDYQIQLHMDTVWIYDYDRLVGKFVNEEWDSKLDSIIMKDNL